MTWLTVAVKNILWKEQNIMITPQLYGCLNRPHWIYKVNSYYKMVNLTFCHQQPPVIEHLTDLDIEQCRIRPLQLDQPCHNQCVERHVKMVTEAAAQVEGFERRDGLIRQKIKSRKLLKKFDTKVQF